MKRNTSLNLEIIQVTKDFTEAMGFPMTDLYVCKCGHRFSEPASEEVFAGVATMPGSPLDGVTPPEHEEVCPECGSVEIEKTREVA